MSLRCYCCGAPLGKTFSIVAYKDGADRAFVMLDEHTEKVLDKEHMVVIRVRALAQTQAKEG